MKRRLFSTVATILAVVALVATLFIGQGPHVQFETVARAEFSKLVPIGGGTPAKRLSNALGDAGYSGPSAMDELTLCVPSGNTNIMYLGSTSAVDNTNGFPLEQGTCITYRAAGRPIEASSIFLFVATTESAAVSLRQR